MKNTLVIGLAVWVCFLAEYFLAQTVPVWLRPNILLLLVIFLNIYRGIRHSFRAAFLGGLVQDAFAVELFGLNILTLLLCAYFTTVLKMYFYEPGAGRSRLLLVFLVSILWGVTGSFLRMVFAPLELVAVIRHVMLPQVFATTVFSVFILKVFRICALKFFA